MPARKCPDASWRESADYVWLLTPDEAIQRDRQFAHANERQRNAMTLQKDDSCRVYRTEFYEAAVTRQNITHCEEDDMRQSTLKVIDAEINAFNDLIATYCSD